MTELKPAERHPTTRACREAFRALLRSPGDAAAKMLAASELEACGRRRLAAALRYAALTRSQPTKDRHYVTWYEDIRYDCVAVRWLQDIRVLDWQKVFTQSRCNSTTHRAYYRLGVALEAVGLRAPAPEEAEAP